MKELVARTRSETSGVSLALGFLGAFAACDGLGKTRGSDGEPTTTAPKFAYEASLANGLSVTFLNRPTAPLIWAQLVFAPTGQDEQDESDEVFAPTCLRLMSQGPSFLGRDAYLERLRTSGTAIEVSGDRRPTVYLTTLTSRIGEATKLLREVLRDPAFRQEDLRRVREADEADAQRGQDPKMLGERIAIEAALGRLPMPGSMLPARLAVTVDDCKRWVKKSLGPRGARLAVVGDTTAVTLMEHVKAQFADWRGPDGRRQTAVPSRKVPQREGPGQFFFIESEGDTSLIASAYRTASISEGASGIAARLVGLELGGTLRATVASLTYGLQSNVHDRGDAEVQYNAVVVDASDTAAALESTERAFAAIRVAPVEDFVQPSLKHGVLAIVMEPLDRGAGLRDFLVRWNGDNAGLVDPARLPVLVQTTDTAAVGRALMDVAAERVVYVVVGSRKVALPQLLDTIRKRRGGDVWTVTPTGRIERGVPPVGPQR